jgi:type I restriction enzyme S subunit
MKRTEDMPASWVEAPLSDIARHDLGKVLDPGFAALDPVLIPPLNEQRRIVAKVEALRRRARRARAVLGVIPSLLEPLRRAVLAAAFRGGLTADWRAGNPDVEPALALLERIRAERRRRWEEAELAMMAAQGQAPEDDRWQARYQEPWASEVQAPSSLPASWLYLPLDELSSLITSGSRGWSRYHGRGADTIVLARNVARGRLDLSKRRRVDAPQTDSEIVKTEIEKDDVLIAIAGANAGDVCRAPEDLPGHYVGPSVAVVRPVLAELSPFILYYLACAEHGQRRLRELVHGPSRPEQRRRRLSADQVRTTMIPLPPQRELAEILDRIRTSSRQAAAVRSRVAKAEGTFARLEQAILAKAFRGELVPQDPDDESASELLERLRAERAAQTSARRRRRRARVKRLAAAEPPRPSVALAPAPATDPALANSRDYTLDDWRRALLASIGDEPADRQDAIEAAAIWAAENMGLVFERLPKNGLIVRGLKSALRSAIRRGEIERLGPSEVRLVPRRS